MPTVVELQDSLRHELKDPFGRIFTDADALLTETGRPLVTVGDVVTYHVLEAGTTPDVALVDERTEREAVDETVVETIEDADFDRRVQVTNPAATLTEELLDALSTALERAPATTTLLFVDGEEDLAALPAIAAAPAGAAVVYGQPDEGMVHVAVDEAIRSTVTALISRMNGDPSRVWNRLDVSE